MPHDVHHPASLATAILHATVVRLEADDVVVALGDGMEVVCDVLVTAHATLLTLAPQDRVLVVAEPGADRGVILGRVGMSHAAAPASLVIEAGQSLTLRVGDGSITMREDGRILIRGTDLVSHARRMNRVKGGAVSIN